MGDSMPPHDGCPIGWTHGPSRAHTDDSSAWGLPAPEGVIALINGVWSYRTAPGRRAEVTSSDTWLPKQNLAS